MELHDNQINQAIRKELDEMRLLILILIQLKLLDEKDGGLKQEMGLALMP